MESSLASTLTKKQQYQRRYQLLKTERGTWDPHWRELSDYVMPRRSRFLQSDINRGSEKNDSIINGTATWGLRVLSSGMMAGITSPARDWFRLTTPDPDLAEMGAVKEWLYVVENRLRLAFQRSNLYQSLQVVYQDLGWCGTAVMHVEEDVEDLLRTYVIPVGQYCLANSPRLRVDTVYREFGMTVLQLVQKFSLEKCSDMVQAAYRNGNYDTWIQVCHVMQPNLDLVHGRMGARGMRWGSCYYERDAGGQDDKLLREEGYAELAALCPRWTITGEDVYGSAPAMDALGDVRALQTLERMAGEAFDKIVSPPMRAPMSLMSQAVSLLPGGMNYFDHANPSDAFGPLMTIHPQAIEVVERKISSHERRIKTAFFADLFLAALDAEGGRMTAREVAERHEEKLLQLGPVMERLQDELLDPLIRRAFGILWRGGYIPPPPKELAGQDLRVEYISTMAQAQKMIGTAGVERVASFVGNQAGVHPDILDKVDFDQMVDEYAGMLGVPPRIIRTDEQVAEIRAQREQAKAAAAQQQQAMQAVQGAQIMSQTDMSSDNALTRAANAFGGQTAGAAGLGGKPSA
jgi:hypothetical protein